MDAKALRQNPELFRHIMRNAVEDIFAGSSSDDCATPKRNPQTDVFQTEGAALRTTFKTSMYKIIDDMWSEYEIADKSTHLYQLEMQAPPDYIAWRPTTGEVPALRITGNYLTGLKAILMHKIEKCKHKNEELKYQLVARTALLKKSSRKYAKLEEHLMNLRNEYERLLHS